MGDSLDSPGLGESYLAEQLCQKAHYSAEQFRKIAYYLAEHQIKINYISKLWTLWLRSFLTIWDISNTNLLN